MVANEKDGSTEDNNRDSKSAIGKRWWLLVLNSMVDSVMWPVLDTDTRVIMGKRQSFTQKAVQNG
jgi:hypothetical protein